MMAKKKAAQKKTLLPHKEVTVKSRAYGEHTRAARGSKVPLSINKVLQENVKKTAAINNTAKRVHDLLKHCGEHFKEAMLWQVMLGNMRKAASMDVVDLLTTLKGMELNSTYPLSRYAYPYVSNVVWGKKMCGMILHTSHPHIKSADTEYRYEMFLLTLGKEAVDDGLVSVMSEWMPKAETDGEIKLSFAVPSKVAYYVVCLHFMTGKNGKATGTLASRGMRIVEVGKGNYDAKKKVKTLG